MSISGGIVEYASPGDHLTFTAGGTITGGQMVKLSANRTVIATAGAAETSVIGVALYNAANGDTNLTVATDGVWPLTASGAIAAGDNLTGAAAGAVVTNNAATAVSMVGKALEAISSTATGRCKLML